MTKRKNLKQKLKAANRRRQQRSASASNSATQVADSPSSSGRSLDVLGLIVQTIVDHTGDDANDNSDAMIVAAMRSNLKNAQPSGDSAKALNASLTTIASRDDVKTAVFRKALESLLTSASDHQEADSPHAFREYLHLLTR